MKLVESKKILLISNGQVLVSSPCFHWIVKSLTLVLSEGVTYRDELLVDVTAGVFLDSGALKSSYDSKKLQ